jgi:hypothetical protein
MDNFVDAEYTNILKEADVEPGIRRWSIDSFEPPKLTFRASRPRSGPGHHSIRLPYEWSAPDEEP